jgi:hypothetical protein
MISSRASQENSLLDITHSAGSLKDHEPVVETKIKSLLKCFQLEGHTFWEVEWNEPSAFAFKSHHESKTFEEEDKLKVKYSAEFEMVKNEFIRLKH